MQILKTVPRPATTTDSIKHKAMQKLKILTLSALAMMLVACQGGKTSDAPQADSTAAEAMTEAVDAAVAQADSAVAELQACLDADHKDATHIERVINQAQATIEHLRAQGDTLAAAAYASRLQSYVQQKANLIEQAAPATSAVISAINEAATLPQNVTSAVQQAAAETKSAAQTKVDQAKADVEAKAEDRVDQVKAEAKQKAASKVQEAEQKANETVAKGLQKLLK